MRDERLYLEDILEAAKSIETFLKNHTKEDLVASDLLQSAIIQKFSVIGEASSRISRGLKSRFPQVEWRKIIGIRNIMVHAYFAVDWNLIWETVNVDLPVLIEQIDEIILTEFGSDSSDIAN
jgi:uncharacterized protein with HEPN domain